MGPAGKQGSFRLLFVRLLFFGVMFVAVRFMYGAIVLGEKCDALDFCFFSQPQTESSSMAGENSSPNPVWSTRKWRRTVFYYSAIFQDLLNNEFLSNTSKSLCMDAETGQEVLALKEIGVVDAVGVSKKKSLPLVVAGNLFGLPFDNSTFDFIFCGHHTIERSPRPANLAMEITRTLKSDGFLVVHTSSAGDSYSYNSFLNLFPGFVLQRNRETRGLDNSPAREIILQKSEEQNSEEDPSTFECVMPEYKSKLLQSVEPLIEEEPLKPWITLKKNAKNIKYLSSMVDINFKTRYVYIDVGARSYGSSIVSWFKKQYPKQNKTFEIYAIEADQTFYKEYESKKGVNLVKFAAWVRNETLSFEVNGGEGRRGMGRVVPAASSAVGSDQTRVVDEIQGLDFAGWLKSVVSVTDYVVMKMDIEGAEFDVLPRLIETGAICLIDELFLECHYNRWQKCCPGKRSPKYQNTYGQCFDLFSKLRGSGVLVHQWW
ncbi:methyltransferase [Wolffia australiana]